MPQITCLPQKIDEKKRRVDVFSNQNQANPEIEKYATSQTGVFCIDDTGSMKLLDSNVLWPKK